MASREVNELVVKLLAVADKIGGRDRDDILHYVGRLSRAAERERAAAVDEMRFLHRVIERKENELRHLENTPQNQQPRVAPTAPAAPASRTQPARLAKGYGRLTDDRILTVPSGPTRPLDYGSDQNRLPRLDDVPQPTRKTATATARNVTAAPHHEQTHASARVPLAPAAAAAPSLQLVAQDRIGYGHFNQARLLALKTHAESDSDHFGGPTPAPLLREVTNANAEPVGRRGKQHENPTGRPGSMAEATGQLPGDISSRTHAGQKRKASDKSVTDVLVSKKEVIGETSVTAVAVTHPHPYQHTRMPMASGLPSAVNTHGTTTAAYGYSGAADRRHFSCMRCVNMGQTDCDGENQCHGCRGRSKCIYVLCDVADCSNEACVKIHPSQYDLSTNVPKKQRRTVLYDNKTEESLAMFEKVDLDVAIPRMDALRAGAPLQGTTFSVSARNAKAWEAMNTQQARMGKLSTVAPVAVDHIEKATKAQAKAARAQAMANKQVQATLKMMLQNGAPVPGTITWQAHKVQVKKEKINGEVRTNALQTAQTGALPPAPETSIRQARDDHIKQEDIDEGASTNIMQTGAPVFGANIRQTRGAQVEKEDFGQQARIKTFSTAPLVFGASIWQKHFNQQAQVNTWLTGATGPGTSLWEPRDVQARKENLGQQAQEDALPTGAPLPGTSVAAVFGDVLQAPNAQVKEKGVDQGKPHSGFGSMSYVDDNHFRIPQAVRNTSLTAQTSARVQGEWWKD